jgi:D-alanyl-D-alanine carboxypeptidase
MRALWILILLCGVARADVVTGYRKGRPIKLRVVTIGWAEVEKSTAKAFRAMRAAAARDGVELVIWSGFRSYERQEALYERWRAGRGNRAARPGHSLHQSGRALDLRIRDARTRSWLKRNARRYGFRATVRDEPWHWEYVPRSRRSVARDG